MVKIYTKTGDKGQSARWGRQRLPKTHLLFEATGTVDELSAVLGLARSASTNTSINSFLVEAQAMLFRLGTDLSVPLSQRPPLPRIGAADVNQLEKQIDLWEARLPPLKNFIHAGPPLLAATIHLARAIARRAERAVLRIPGRRPGPHSVYLNRLSDALFVLARWAAHTQGMSDRLWNIRGQRA